MINSNYKKNIYNLKQQILFCVHVLLETVTNTVKLLKCIDLTKKKNYVGKISFQRNVDITNMTRSFIGISEFIPIFYFVCTYILLNSYIIISIL